MTRPRRDHYGGVFACPESGGSRLPAVQQRGPASSRITVPAASDSRTRHALRLVWGEAEGMPAVIVYPPGETGGRRVRIGEEILGTAFSLQDLTVFLQHAGLEGWDELDVAGWDQIEWRGGGPDVWNL